jgi:TonB family protein
MMQPGNSYQDCGPMLDYIGDEYSPHSSFLIGLESSVDETLLRPPRELAAKELVLGAGGSLLAHVLVVLATMMLVFIQPPSNFTGTFVTVSLVNGESIGGDADGSGKGTGSHTVQTSSECGPTDTSIKTTADLPNDAVHFEELSPGEKQPDNLVAPDTPKALKRIASAEKSSNSSTAHSETKPKLSSKPILPDAKEAVALSASQEPSPEVAGAGWNSEKEQGENKGGRGGLGALASEGSSSGTGSYSGEFNANAVDQTPQVLQKVEPFYPQRARHLGVSGRVVVKFLVQADGHVSRPSILEAEPEGYFEQNALEAIRRWRFKPGYYRGKAVATWVTLPVQFRLTE